MVRTGPGNRAGAGRADRAGLRAGRSASACRPRWRWGARGRGARAGESDELTTLHAVSIKARREVWAVDVSARNDDYQRLIPRGWWAFWDDGDFGVFPLVADLDGDGRSEIVVADWGALMLCSGYRGVCLIDGSDGKVRWRRPMRPENNVWGWALASRRGTGPRWRRCSRRGGCFSICGAESDGAPVGGPRRTRARLCRRVVGQGRPCSVVVAHGPGREEAHIYLGALVVGTRTGWVADGGHSARRFL